MMAAQGGRSGLNVSIFPGDSPASLFSSLRGVCVCVCVVRSRSVRPCGLRPPRLLWPWDPPGKNTGVGCHALLQGIFLTQGWTLCLWNLLPWQVGSLPLHHLGSPLGA